MPNRILRDGINSSERINKLSPGAEILYRRLMSVADDYGRFYASPATVRGACWPTAPGKVREQDVSKWLTECATGERPLIRIYEVSGCRFLEITGFGQQIRSKSKFPEYDINLLSTCEQTPITSRSRISESESKTKSDMCTWFERFWQAYPRKEARTDAEAAFGRLKPTEELLAKMLLAIERRKGSHDWTKSDGQFIPMPASWLKKRRWEDEIPLPSSNRKQINSTPLCGKCGFAETLHIEVKPGVTLATAQQVLGVCENYRPVPTLTGAKKD